MASRKNNKLTQRNHGKADKKSKADWQSSQKETNRGVFVITNK